MILQEKDFNSIDTENIYSYISYQICNQCSVRIKSQVWAKILDKIRPQVKDQVRSSIETKLWNKIWKKYYE